MNLNTTARLPAFILSAAMTFGILFGLDALATTGQSSEALLAQQGQQLVSCPVVSRQA